MAWGGARRGAGKKRNPAKQLARATSENTAERILKEIGWEQDIVEIYRNCGKAELKLQIIIALQARAWGRPEVAKPTKKTNESDGSTGNSIQRLEQLLVRAGALQPVSGDTPTGKPN